MPLKQVIRGCWALFLCAVLAAQDGGRWPFAVVGPDQGMPPGAPICIAQDEEGFLWLGSENGLVRYASGQWRLWTTEDGLPAPYVSRLLSAKDGLWMPTYRGLVRFQAGRIERALLGGLPSSGAAAYVALDRQGRVWASTSQGVFVQREGLAFDPLDWHPDLQGAALTAGAQSGAMYVAGAGGIHAYLPDGTKRTWGPAEGLPKEGVSLLVEDGLGRLWAGSGPTLRMKAPGSARFTDRSSDLPGSLSPNSQPFLDGDGSVWLPTQNGVLHIDGARVERIDASNGLPFRWARTLFRDREGTLWIIGPALARLQGGGRVWNYGLSQGPTGEVVWWVTRDHEGRLLVGTDDGAARMGAHGLERVPGTEGRRIKSLAQDRTGTLWMVSTTGPAYWLPPGRTRAEPAPFGELGTFVNSVTEDSKGRVWFGHTRQGVLRWDPAARRLVPELGPEFVHEPAFGAFAMKEDAEGRLWMGSTHGLLVREIDGRWQLFTEKDGLRPHYVRGLAFLPDGSAWVHYQEPKGLTRVRLEHGRLRVLEHRVKGQGLRTNLIYAVQADAFGQAWASTDQGLERLDRPMHVGRQEGMASEDCSVHALLLEGNRVWVGTGAGLVRYDSGPADTATPPPEARILQALCGARVLEPPFAGLGTVPHGDATVAFRVTAATYLRERDLRLQVRLAGLENAWRDLDGHLARYPALPGGKYRFEVRAARGDEPFGPVTGVDLRVRPAWWLTWWALALWIMAGLGAAYGMLKIRLAALARRQAALEGLVARRTEELQTRNEELSSALTRVKQLSGLLPICACCKKIRDDRGYWNQLEHYISEHSEADFTHGICPECAKVMFPEVRGRELPEPEGPE